MNFFYKNKLRFLGLLIVLIFIEIFVLSAQFLPSKKISSATASEIQKYANNVVSKCSTAKDHPTCYDKEIPKLMDYISMEDAFKVTVAVQDKDSSYKYCHVLAHELSAREVDKDPSKWKDVITRCPSGVCSNGCLHGGFQERFRAESLSDSQIQAIKPDLKTLCEEKPNWHPTGLEQASCYHAMGHLTMYMTNADINKSLALCTEISKKSDGRDYSHLCFDGAFMQIYQPLEPEDFALVKGKQPDKITVLSFCDKFTNQQRGSCISESWPLFRAELQNPDFLTTFCSNETPEELNRCYSSTFYVLTPQFQFDQTKIQNYCSALPSGVKGLCFANAASRMIETDYRNISDAIKLCGTAQDASSQCFQELLLYSHYNYHKGSKEFLNMCNSLPDELKSQCLVGT